MNSIEEKRNNTVHEKQFDKMLQETKDQIEQICRGIEVKKHLGENSYNHYTYDKKYYIDEVIKYFEGKAIGFSACLRNALFPIRLISSGKNIAISQEVLCLSSYPKKKRI